MHIRKQAKQVLTPMLVQKQHSQPFSSEKLLVRASQRCSRPQQIRGILWHQLQPMASQKLLPHSPDRLLASCAWPVLRSREAMAGQDGPATSHFRPCWTCISNRWQISIFERRLGLDFMQLCLLESRTLLSHSSPWQILRGGASDLLLDHLSETQQTSAALLEPRKRLLTRHSWSIQEHLRSEGCACHSPRPGRW